MIVAKQCTNCSFDVVATQFYECLVKEKGINAFQKIGCGGNIEFIDVNLWYTQCRTIDDSDMPNSVVRGDSPYVRVSGDVVKNHVLVTTSNYNAELFGKLFAHVVVIPHPYDVRELEVVGKVLAKRYDVVTIGYNTPDDRKGFTIARRVAKDLGLRYIEVSNECDKAKAYGFECVPFMSLSRDELYELIARSRFYLALSHTEGFGLPVLEAMVAGVIPIYVDGHAFHEYAYGIRIPAYRDGRRDWFDYDYEDVVDAVKYAIGLDEREYEELSDKVKRIAIERHDPKKLYNELFSLVFSGLGRY